VMDSLPSKEHEDIEEPRSNALRRLSTLRSRISRTYSQVSEPEDEDDALDWRTLPGVATETPVNRSLGLTWKNLIIKGAAAGGTVNENVLSQFFPPFLRKDKFATTSTKTIINNSSGCVKPGEMLLVLGRPGAGCTSLLKVLGQQTQRL
jgi:ATP-binding cassette subfamily G (WHITE) protein 2 (SNQ2)